MSQLSTNTESLQAILDAVNALPDSELETEEWTFVLMDGTTVTKKVYVGD